MKNLKGGFSTETQKLWKLVFLLPPIILPILYAAGYLSQFFINYNAWLDNGYSLGSSVSPGFPSGSPSACFHAMTIFPYNLYGIFIYLSLLGLLIFMVMRMGFGDKQIYDEERNLKYSVRVLMETSGFMTEEEMHKVLELVKDQPHKQDYPWETGESHLPAGEYKNEPEYLPLTVPPVP
ncbi:MAG: hypothetical protein ACLTW9_27100 [Enterocloster sp.]